MATQKVMQFASIGVPSGLLSFAGIYLYRKRAEYMQDPVFQRGLLHLKKDQRVQDFCGEQIEPGWLITRDKRPGENWVKYEFNIKGGSGKLQTVMIGDHLKHIDLTELEIERQQYFEKIAKQQSDKQNKEATPEDKKIEAEYLPVDFDAYSIADKESKKNQGPIQNKEKIWRISSLTASVDKETKILILPVPESRRTVKIQDTKYSIDTYENLHGRSNKIEEGLLIDKEIVKRYEDKTKEEIEQDQIRKRKQQFGKLYKYRTYQFGSIAIGGFFYLFVYRRFLHPKSITNSVIYNQTLSFVKQNQKCSDVLGTNFQIMSCNGKMLPYKSDVNFEIVAFGTNAKGKLWVESTYDKSLSQWKLTKIDLKTTNETTSVL